MLAIQGKSVSKLWHVAIILAAAAIAWFGARTTPGGWNDRSRLAMVESLVERGTFVIDDSIFAVNRQTMDKLLIDGHFYSDKSPVPGVLMAGEYWVWRKATGQTAITRQAAFCKMMSFASCGIAYVVAVWSIFMLGGVLRLPLKTQLLLTASFGLATLAPAYAQRVNNHILQLGVMAPLMLGLVCLRVRQAQGRSTTGWLLGVGALTGLAYTVDLGVGPVLLMCTGGLVVWRFRAVWPVLLFVVAALPFLALHHGLNYHIGVTWKPANAVSEYLDYPGSPFSEQNMTGHWQHPNVGRYVVYTLDLLFGKKGFLGHNLALFLVLPAAWVLWRKRPRELPEVLFALALCGGTVLLYAAASNNFSGVCYSVRWFVPLLGPGYFLLALYLRDEPSTLRSFLILSCGGLALSVWMMAHGPWTGKMIPHFWPVQTVVLGTCIWLARRPTKPKQAKSEKTVRAAA